MEFSQNNNITMFKQRKGNVETPLEYYDCNFLKSVMRWKEISILNTVLHIKLKTCEGPYVRISHDNKLIIS